MYVIYDIYIIYVIYGIYVIYVIYVSYVMYVIYVIYIIYVIYVIYVIDIIYIFPRLTPTPGPGDLGHKAAKSYTANAQSKTQGGHPTLSTPLTGIPRAEESDQSKYYTRGCFTRPHQDTPLVGMPRAKERAREKTVQGL